MNRCELAYQYHKKGYNCAQSVLMSFQDVAGLSEKQCLAIASGFGAGAGARLLGHSRSGASSTVYFSGRSLPFPPSTGALLAERIRILLRFIAVMCSL